jgi:hypothetical protein
MKPHSFRTIQFVPKSVDERFRDLGPIAARHGRFPKGTVLPETQVEACPRVKISELPDGFIPLRYFERNLEQNQIVNTCCRHPENYEVEARKSHHDEQFPDIYVFYCTVCKHKHSRFLVYQTSETPRPMWDAS